MMGSRLFFAQVLFLSSGLAELSAASPVSPVAFPQEFSPALLDRFVCLGHVDRLCETHLASKRFFQGKI